MGHSFDHSTLSGKRFRIIVRRDTIYDVKANNLFEAQQAAQEEDYTKIIDEEVDYVRITDMFEVALDGTMLPSPASVDEETRSISKDT